MPVTSTTDRLLGLYQLRLKVDREIDQLERQERARRARQRRSRYDPPPCGTEQGYQRHRYDGRTSAGEWPLPPKDPCGCRAAHAEHRAVEKANQRAAERGRRRRAQVAS